MSSSSVSPVVPSSLPALDILFLHPGAMGARLAGSCAGAGRRLWSADGRSDATRDRADAEGLEAIPDLAGGLAEVDVVMSVCPPAAAEAVADQVAGTGFDGIYVDANAIAPATTRRIAERFERFVDGGIIGPPPAEAGTTRLYLSGPHAEASAVAGLWTGSELDARVLVGDVGLASALKMAYAAWTKGSAALLATIVAGADATGVRTELGREWDLSQPGLNDRVSRTAAGVGPKAWRFAGEMEEIASTFAGVNLPAGFWEASAEAYHRLAPLKDQQQPLVDDLIQQLLAESG